MVEGSPEPSRLAATPPPPGPIPQGWYPDPEDPGSQRYWDGNGWTESRAPGREPKTSGFAIASLVLGIVWLYWVGSILAVIFGHIALSQIKDGRASGRGLALAGTILGWVGIGVAVLLLILALAAGTQDSSDLSYI